MSTLVTPASEKHPAVIETGGVRKFGDVQLQGQLDAIYARMPETAKAITVGVTLNEKKDVAVFAVAKLSNGFSIMGAVDKKWQGPVTAQVMLGWVGH